MPAVRPTINNYRIETLTDLYHTLKQTRGDRIARSNKILKNWWPDHCSIFINSFNTYGSIDQHLDQAQSPVLIMQNEEDWFLYLDWHDIRQRIKQHPNWCDQSLIISNSRWDCEMMTRFGISNQCKPGLLDLMVYRELPEIVWQPNLVQYHTSVMFAHISWSRDTGRIKLCELLENNQDRVGCIVTPVTFVDNCPEVTARCTIDNLDNLCNVDAPNIPLDADYYLRTIAFSVVLETEYRGHWCPTTSEKTYRCFHNQVPALVCAGHNTRRYLLGLGFDTCDWLFDWSWDSEPDPDARFQGFLLELQRLLLQPLDYIKTLIEQNRSSLVHNQHNVRRLICNYDTLDNRLW